MWRKTKVSGNSIGLNMELTERKMENPVVVSDNNQFIHANNSTIYNNCIVNNNCNIGSPPTTGRKRKRNGRKRKRLNPGRSDNEMNGGKGSRLEDIIEETSRKYVLRDVLLRDLLHHLQESVKQQDVHWTTNKLVGGVHSYARDELYKHFEVPEEGVEDIRSNLRKEESVVDEVYKVLNYGLRVRVHRTRGYLLQKLYEQDENLARSFIEYLFEEMINEINKDADKRENGGSCHSPSLCIQNATNDVAART